MLRDGAPPRKGLRPRRIDERTCGWGAIQRQVEVEHRVQLLPGPIHGLAVPSELRPHIFAPPFDHQALLRKKLGGILGACGVAPGRANSEALYPTSETANGVAVTAPQGRKGPV